MPTFIKITDNGSEFAGHFDLFLEKNGIIHFHSYPKCPKMNTEIERFNLNLINMVYENYRCAQKALSAPFDKHANWRKQSEILKLP